MSGSMQIFVIEQRLYELEEKVFKFLKDVDDRLVVYEIKMGKYEEFLKNYEGGIKLPKTIENNLKGHVEEISKSRRKLISIKKENAKKEEKKLLRTKEREQKWKY